MPYIVKDKIAIITGSAQGIGKEFAKKVNQHDKDTDMPIPFNDDYNDGQFSNTMFEMHRKNVSQALYSKWIREELKDR